MQLDKFLYYLGVGANPVSHLEKIISGIGGFLAIFSIIYISSLYVGAEEAVYIVPSMGASAVLLFAVPHSALGQLWNVIGGHLISAAIGVACAQWLPGGGIAAAASVGLAIGVMYYARCIHPPGGATALAAVIGGPNIHALGYEYILTPIAINTVTILMVALLFNALFRWRRYPAFLIPKKSGLDSAHKAYAPVDHANFVYALSQMDTFIDVTEDDLLKIYQLATGREVNLNSE
ncbi:MAG: HPP family protein [SAR324 cluster bacterium]|nr:HPP family protein [SAR324 cluster bacterium]